MPLARNASCTSFTAVVFFGIVACARPAEREVGPLPTPPDSADVALGARIHSYLERAEALGYSGVWLIERRGYPLVQAGYGFADRERGIRFTDDSPFPLASIVKQFTAAAILGLQDEGRLSVSDSITRFFPHAPADKRAITIHHLLTHTAGLPTYSGPDSELITRDTLIARMMGARLLNAPGVKFEYSNPGYSLLAVILEEVTGKDYERYIGERFLQPLGMAQTTWDLAQLRQPVPVRAPRLGDPKDQPIALSPSNRFPDGKPSWNLRGNSGFASTSRDLRLWAEAWNRGTILSDSARRAATTRHVPWDADSTRFYGYGWILEGSPPARVEYHSGGDGFHAAYVNRYVDVGFITVNYTNQSRGPSQFVAPAVRAALLGSPLPDLPATRTTVDEKALQRLAGSYLLPSGDTLAVIISNGQLAVANDRRGAAAAVTCFPPLADSSLVRDIGPRVRSAFAALSRGDLGPLLAVIWPAPTSAEGERDYWGKTWPEWIDRYGAYRGMELLGSRRGSSSLQRGVPIVDTYVLLHFDRGQYLVTVKQDPQKRLFLDTSTTWLLQPFYYYVPQTANSFETFNFMLRTRSPLNFVTASDGTATGLTVGCNQSSVATRLPS